MQALIKKLMVLALMGASLGTFCDHCHVWGGVLAYRNPFIDGQAWWVMPLFAWAAVMVAVGYGLGEKLTGTRLAPISRRRGVGYGLFFLGAYGATAIFSDWPNALLVLLTLGFVSILLIEKDRALLVSALLTAVAGSLFEAALSSTGAFYYLHPDFLGIPRWLPALYFWAALSAAVSWRWR